MIDLAIEDSLQQAAGNALAIAVHVWKKPCENNGKGVIRASLDSGQQYRMHS